MGDSLEHLGAWDCYMHCALIAIRPESNISMHHLLGHVDDYVGALPCLHCIPTPPPPPSPAMSAL